MPINGPSLDVFLGNGLVGEGVEDEETELRFTPGNKRRRTTVGRPQTSKSPGDSPAAYMWMFMSGQCTTPGGKGGGGGSQEVDWCLPAQIPEFLRAAFILSELSRERQDPIWAAAEQQDATCLYRY